MEVRAKLRLVQMLASATARQGTLARAASACKANVQATMAWLVAVAPGDCVKRQQTSAIAAPTSRAKRARSTRSLAHSLTVNLAAVMGFAPGVLRKAVAGVMRDSRALLVELTRANAEKTSRTIASATVSAIAPLIVSAMLATSPATTARH